MNGVPMVGVVVIPQPGANHIKIADAVYDRMERMQKDLPEDVHYNYGFDNTKFIRASIDEVEQTVYEAFKLAAKKAPEMGVAAMAVSLAAVPVVSMFTKKYDDKFLDGVFAKNADED